MWTQYESCLYYKPSSFDIKDGKCKLASFDLDSTLILSDRGEKYSKGTNDWVWAYPNVASLLQGYVREGWTVAIFSNRKVPPWELRASKIRMEQMMKQLGISMWIFFSTKADKYRKPEIGMMNLFCSLASIREWDPSSFYCGDAYGPESKISWNQWSDADKVFSSRIGLPFYEPHILFDDWSVVIPEGIDLIYTVGVKSSGWDQFTPYIGQYVPIDKKRSLYIVSDAKQSFNGPEHKSKVITVVLGTHPTEAHRDLIKEKYEKTFGRKPSVLVYWYARSNEIDKIYTSTYQKITDPYVRVN